MSNVVSELIELSHLIGKKPYFVQGGGGNTSIKLNATEMLIKASGSELAQMKDNFGYCTINYQKISDLFHGEEIEAFAEEKVTEFINKQVIGGVEDIKTILELDQPSDLKAMASECTNKYMIEPESCQIAKDHLRAGIVVRPSIEAGFHSIIAQKYVAHSHSVYVNVLNCAKGGRDKLLEMFPDAVWIDYANPGKDIALKFLEKPDGKIYFMQNHGLLVAADSFQEICHLHEEINEKVKKIIPFSKLNQTSNFRAKTKECTQKYMTEVATREITKDHLRVGNGVIGYTDLDYINQHDCDETEVLFPDQVVYLLDESLKNTVAGKETVFAYNFIRTYIEKLGMQPEYISVDDVNIIKNMESEKFRKKMVK